MSLLKMNNENKKVIYSSFSNERQVIVDYLYENHNWEPVLFFGDKNVHNWINDKYPKSIFADNMEIRQAKFDYSKIGAPVPIDAKLISNLSEFESNFFNTLEDTNNFNYSYFERRSYYYEILKYWNSVIQRLKPDLFILLNSPHTATCYSLYLLCKYHYSINVLFLEPYPLFNMKYHYMGISLEKSHSVIMKLYNSGEELYPSKEVLNYLNEVRSIHGKTDNIINSIWDGIKKNSSLFRFKHFFKLLIHTLITGSGLRKAHVAWKKNKLPYYLPSSRFNNLEYFLFVERLRNKNKKLLKYYNPLCVEPDLNKKYIYFPASYQPEALTEVNAGVYHNLFLVLDILSYVLPKDWVIYYKENPVIFDRAPWIKGALRRDKYYFQKIDSYQNIKMISATYNTFKLIDSAQAVATVSGTVAWEAVLRGKPAISFGSAWYMGCKSIFWIKTLKEAEEAMKKIEVGFVPDQQDIERYAASVEAATVKGMINSHDGIKIQLNNKKDNMLKMAKGIYEYYITHCKNASYSEVK